MKIKIALFLIICFASVGLVFPQKDTSQGLILRGRIYEGEKEEYKDYVLWKAKLAMELVNTGDKPVILINPAKEFPQWQSEVKLWSGRNSLFSFTKNITRPQKSADELKILAEFLAGDEPPPNQFIIISPQETIAFEDNLEVEQKFTKGKEKYASPKWEGSFSGKLSYPCPDYCSSPLSALKYLQIKYEFSLVKYQINPDLLEILQDRWSNIGILPVDVNGGFSITSAPIDNNVTYKKIK